MDPVLVSSSVFKAIEVVSQPQHWTLGGWVAGIAATMALPLVFKWLNGTGVQMLIAWQLDRVTTILANGSSDAAWEEFEVDITLAVVKMAQAKFPGDGLGPEREKMVIDLLTSKIPLLRGQEGRLRTLIQTVVAKEKGLLATIKAKALAARLPASA